MDDAVVKIERTCVYADVRRLCSEVGRGRNIGLHNLFRLYTDGGKSDASRALYLFRNVGRYGRGEDGTPGKRRAIDFPSHVRCWRSSFVFPKRPASVDTTDLLSHPARHSRNSLMKPTFRPIFRVTPLSSIALLRRYAINEIIARRGEKIFASRFTRFAISNETRLSTRRAVNFQYYSRVCFLVRTRYLPLHVAPRMR